MSKSGLGEIGELGDEGTCVVFFPEEQASQSAGAFEGTVYDTRSLAHKNRRHDFRHGQDRLGKHLPPRITARNAINPPQHMAQQLGFPDDVIFSTVYYNGQPVMPFTLLLHFSFAIVFSILFILLIQKWKQVGMAQGAVYGLIIWVAWHVILMLLFGTVPAPWDQPLRGALQRDSRPRRVGLVDCRSCVLPDQASEGQHAHLPRVIRFQVSRPEQKGPAHRN